jgi:hypothetical protein
VQEFADEMLHKQTQLIGEILDQSQGVIDTMKAVDARITAARTAWQQQPTPDNGAALAEAVTQGAAQGREAAEHMAEIQTKARGVVAELRKGIADQKRNAQGFVQTAQGLAQRYDAEFRKVQAAALEARNVLDARGQLENGDVPPELADRLERLRVEYQEAADLAQLYEGTAATIAEFVAVFDEADRDFAELDRFAEVTASEFASAGRVLQHVGHAQALNVQVRMAADALQHGRELRARFLAMAQEGRRLRDEQRRVVDAVRQQVRPLHPNEPKPESPRRIEVVDWLRKLPADTRVARTAGEGQ